MKLIHQDVSVILLVVACGQRVDCEKLEIITKRVSTLISEKLPWVNINWTVHGLFHHSTQLIHMNGGWSIGELPEEPLEANNKFVRRYLNQFARTTAPIEQFTDVMNRLNERRNPEVVHRQKQ